MDRILSFFTTRIVEALLVFTLLGAHILILPAQVSN
jgi:hypothetical protein